MDALKRLWERLWRFLMGPPTCQQCLGTGIIRMHSYTSCPYLTRCLRCEGSGHDPD